MKKKLISILAILGCIIPSVFLVACKNKEEQAQAKSYTYSVVLKNAKNKIDESLLTGEYDYSKLDEKFFSSDGNDYKISVTKASNMSGSLKVALLEGVDYSGLKLKVDGKDADFNIKTETQKNVSSSVTLENRFFEYNYKNMSNNIDVVVDFSDCFVADIEVNVAFLNAVAKYKVLDDEFVTLGNSNEFLSSFEQVSGDKITVKYGAMIAFDYNERLTYQRENDGELQISSYACQGSKYLKGDNIIQYFTVKGDGICSIYKTEIDSSFNGTLRVPFDLNVASSLENLNNKVYEKPNYVSETIGSQVVRFSVYSGEKLYFEKDNNSYYLVDSIDAELGIEHKCVSKNDYIQIELTKDGQMLPVKYLFRKNQSEKTSDWFFVYSSTLDDFAVIDNADYVFIGSENYPQNVKNNINENGCVVYGFLGDKTVRLRLNSLVWNDSMTSKVTVSSVKIGEKTFFADDHFADLDTDDMGLVSVNGEVCIYTFTIDETIEEIEENNITLDFYDINLASDEVLYYSKNLTNPVSWKKIVPGGSGATIISSNEIVYYYINSSKPNATLNILDGETIVGVNKNALDCFGRFAKGVIEIFGEEIDLTKVCALSVKPNATSNNRLSVIREFDKSNHKVNGGDYSDEIMVSVGGYKANMFGCLSDVNLQINSISTYDQAIYYYVKSAKASIVTLKNSAGKIVSESNLVYYENAPLILYGKFVYCLTLNRDYYEDSEEFEISVEKVTYNLMKQDEKKVQLYLDSQKSVMAFGMSEDETYYVVAESVEESDEYYQIVDQDGNVIVDQTKISLASNLSGGKDKLYAIEFSIPDGFNYLPGSKFYLVKVTPAQD